VREIDAKFIRDFEAYLVANYRLAHNTLAKHMKDLRHVIGMAMEEDLITKNPFAKHSIRYINTDRGFLTQEEIDKIAGMKFDEIRLEQARDVFLFCCFTGISYSDLKDLKKENAQLAPDGKLWIKGRRVKTGVEYNIPLLNIPKAILGKFSSHLTRHTFATTIALNNGVPLETVSKMLGHTGLKTTQNIRADTQQRD
jgi:site-specific recombinase XerD